MMHNASTVAAAHTSREAVALGEDERYWTLNRLEALWNGQRHRLDPRPSFWDTSVPLRDRAPAVQASLARSAGMRLAHMVAGERSFPLVRVAASGYRVALDEAAHAALQSLASEIVTASRLPVRFRAYLIEGLKTGSAVCVQSLAYGKPCIQILPAKWCTPTRDASGCIVRLVIQYKHPDSQGVLCVYRREIGGGYDRAYQTVPAQRLVDAGFEWSSVPIASEVPIAFVPVVWTRSMCEAVEEGSSIDGHALAEGLEDELDAIDMELSQLYRNALYNGDPQLVRTGVDATMPAMPMGATGRESHGGFSYLNSVLPNWLGGGPPKSMLQKAPGKIWDLAVGSDAKMLESTGAGAGIITSALDRLMRVTTDALGVVMIDPAAMGSGDVSARALALLYGPQLDTADNLRVEYGGALAEIVDQLLRLCAGADAARDGVRLTSWDAARPALAQCWAADATGMRTWNAPPIALTWGEYFEPSWSEISAAVDAATKGVDGRVLSRRRAVELLAPLTGAAVLADEMSAIDNDSADSNAAVSATLGALRDEPAAVDAAPQIDVASTALNGAQVSSLLETVTAVATGQLPRASGVALLQAAFRLPAAEAEAIMGEVGRSFFASTGDVE
jgi:hypothetical protein